MKCPHCEQDSNPKAYPFCSYCRLFLIEVEQLDLSPEASFLVWKKEVTVRLLN